MCSGPVSNLILMTLLLSSFLSHRSMLPSFNVSKVALRYASVICFGVPIPLRVYKMLALDFLL
jgi:hypothetical protein